MSDHRSNQGGLIGKVLLGRYRILRHLADGGMGTIYLARSEGSAGFVRPVVVKCILPSHLGDRRVMDLFAREARIMARLRHPGIVSVIDFAQEGNMHVMVLEYVHGFHLGRWHEYICHTEGKFPVPLATYIIIRVLRALQYAHTLRGSDGKALNLVHRDVTPSNILIDVDGHCKLADFGIAKMRTDRTDAGASRDIKGKPAYIAPEVLANTEPSPASDLYSAGLVLHELLTGQNEFDSEISLAAILTKVVTHVPRRVDEVRSDVSTALADVIARAIAKDPAERFADAGALAAALTDTLSITEDDAAHQLATRAAADFTSADMTVMFEMPSLLELESSWTAAAPEATPAPERKIGFDATMMGYPGDAPAPYGAALSPEAIREVSAPARGAENERRSRKPIWIGASLLVTAGLAALYAMVRVERAPEQPAYIVVDQRAPAPAPPPPIMAGKETSLEPEPAASPDPLDAGPTAPPPIKKPLSDAARLSRDFNKSKTGLSLCLQNHATDLPGTEPMSIRLEVGSDGKVISASLSPNSLASSKLGACILGEAQKARFEPRKAPVSFRVPITAQVK